MQTSQSKKDPVVHNKSTPDSKLLEIERKFDVPAATLFDAFASADAVEAWWWPEGMYADNVDWDFREGGRFFINMKGAQQGGSGMAGIFEEIVREERIVMTDQFADENGRVISAKEANMPGKWPEKGYITLEFEALDDDSSLLHLSQEGIPNEMHKDCIEGWNQMFAKLDKYLKDRRH
ncbi:MAG: SRPBCC domain-containing protein [Bdellovibrio sp.]|nr:SRPBCC domain-containing protein [Bdellovibrio sp.]